jgi:hypothetical protein
MNIRFGLRVALEKFPHFLEGKCGIQEIVSVKKSKQFVGQQLAPEDWPQPPPDDWFRVKRLSFPS